MLRIVLIACLALPWAGCGTMSESRAPSGSSGRDYRLPPQQVRAAAIDTLQAMGMDVESAGASTIVTRMAPVGLVNGDVRHMRGVQSMLRVEVRGMGEHCSVYARAAHLVEVRKGTKTEWVPEPSHGRMEEAFLNRLDTRVGVVK